MQWGEQNFLIVTLLLFLFFFPGIYFSGGFFFFVFQCIFVSLCKIILPSSFFFLVIGSFLAFGWWFLASTCSVCAGLPVWIEEGCHASRCLCLACVSRGIGFVYWLHGGGCLSSSFLS